MNPFLRPMCPRKASTSPQHSFTDEVGRTFSSRKSPTFQLMTSPSLVSTSSSTASILMSVCHSSAVRWLSQMESRPNFSPMNICSSSSRTGSSVA